MYTFFPLRLDLIQPFSALRVIVGEVDEAIDSRIDLSKIRAEPLPSIVH